MCLLTTKVHGISTLRSLLAELAEPDFGKDRQVLAELADIGRLGRNLTGSYSQQRYDTMVSKVCILRKLAISAVTDLFHIALSTLRSFEKRN